MKKCITIFTGDLARHLLRKGYTIKDVKAHRELENATIFIFKNDPGLMEEVHLFRNSNAN